MQKKLHLLILMCLITLSGCTTLTRQEKSTIYELKQYGIREPNETVAHPGVAGALNILPGFGNFYLGSGNGAETIHWLYGFLNLLTWPISIVWGIPEAAIDANTINEREMVNYYLFTPQGQYELQQLRTKYGYRNQQWYPKQD